MTTPSLPDALRALTANLRELAPNLIGPQEVAYRYCADRIDAVADKHGPALEALLRERDWRPIESAPKDGTHILIYDPEMARQQYAVAWWCDFPKGWKVVQLRSGGYSVWDSPPYWMPLPAGPNGAEGDVRPAGDSP